MYVHFDVFVKLETVNVLMALNAGETIYQSVSYDKKFVKALMEDVFGDDEITVLRQLDPRKVEFIKGINGLKISSDLNFK